MEQFEENGRHLRLVVDNKPASIPAEPVAASQGSNYRIDCERRVVAVSFGQKLAVPDIEAYAGALVADPAFDPSFSELVDLTGVEEVTLDARQALELADRIDPFSPESKRAFVSPRPALFHAVRMHQILRSPAENIAIFTSVEAAERWLGLSSGKSS